MGTAARDDRKGRSGGLLHAAARGSRTVPDGSTAAENRTIGFPPFPLGVRHKVDLRRACRLGC